MTNIVRFPTEKIPTKPENLGMPVMTEEQMDDYASEVSADVCSILVAELLENGFSLEDATDKYFKDVALVLEAMRSVIFRMYNKKHTLHELADNIFVIESSDKGMVSIRMLGEEDKIDNPGS
jgi:hypothetical protein